MDASPLMVTALMFGLMVLLMMSGVPLTFALGIVATGVAFWLWGTNGLDMIFLPAFGILNVFVLVALPLFIFMGVVLERSGIADDIFGMVHEVMGGIRGGLAMGTVITCALIAAMVGVSGAATVAMAIIALPAMLKRGYDKQMVSGAIQAGGALGILIPPSTTFIMFGFLTQQSVGRLFAAGLFPGLLLTVLFIIYIGVRCFFQPHLGPPIPQEEQGNWRKKVKALRALILPVLLVFLVLGLILLGVTSPTEAAAVGGFGALLCAAIHRTLTWRMLRESLMTTTRIMGMVMWIVITAIVFSKIYMGLGAPALVQDLLSRWNLGPYGILILMIVTFYILGCFLDHGAILFICIPLYTPIVVSLGFDPIWFGVIYVMSIESAFLTPPFGFNLFYMKALAPPEVTLVDIYKSVIPFVGLQVIGLTLVVIFPQIALWLPNLILGG